MAQRLATTVALLAFAVCLIAGTYGAGNPFTTAVGRALAGMAGTYVVGLVVGHMVKRAVDENLAVNQPVKESTTPTAAAATATSPVKPVNVGGR